MCKRVFDKTIELAKNAMLRHKPYLFGEWDFEKNDRIGLDAYAISQGNGKKAWWICPSCDSSYDMQIKNRCGLNQKCPYCEGRRVNHTNSLASLNPTLAAQWHPTLNDELTSHDVTCGSKKKVWWLGECGHEWDATVVNRSRGKGCTYCSPTSNRILIGFNDMWTTNPSLAILLANPEDGYRYTQSSNKTIDWKCKECEETIKNRLISNICKRGLSCPRCSDGIKFPEKFMYNLLRESNIEFEYEHSPEWSQNKRYDFYLPRYGWIIETHGEQHYGDSFEGIGEGVRSYKEEVENDTLKQKIARDNGICNFVVIDARESTVKHLENSILNSDIMTIIPDIDFKRIGQLASNSFIKIACDLWNSGVRSTTSIATEMKLSNSTVARYLKRGTEIGWCDYSGKEVMRTNGLRSGNLNRKKTIQLSVDNDFIMEWDSAKCASESLNINNITPVCTGKRNIAGGFKWMYKEDYELLVNKL